MCCESLKGLWHLYIVGAFAVEIQIGAGVGRFDVWTGSDRVVASVDIGI